MIPGSNLLNQALTVIASQTVQYFAALSRQTNNIGLVTAVHSAPIDIKGSVQAVPLVNYERLGLDMNREYIMFYASLDMRDAQRDRTTDYLGWNGSRWDIINVTAWHGIDGWSSVLAVNVGALS